MKPYEPLSNSFLLTGNETPIGKLMKAHQIHNDYRVSPLRLAGSLMATGQLPRSESPDVRRIPGLGQQVLPRPQGSPAEFTMLSASTAAKSTKSFSCLNSHIAKAKQQLNSTSPITPVLSRFASESQLKVSTPKVSNKAPLHFSHSNLKRRPAKNSAADSNFVPYTLKDYRSFQRHDKRRLGGLGPVHIGTEVWQEKMKKKKKMLEYSQKFALPKVNGEDRSRSVFKVKSSFGLGM